MESSFQLKGSLFTLSVLQLHTGDLKKLADDLAEKIKLAPKFFQYAPIVVDLKSLDERADELDFLKLNDVLRQNHLIPVGIRGGSDAMQVPAQAAGFATMIDPPQAGDKAKKSVKQTSDPDAGAPQIDQQSTLVSDIGSRLITTPIRSGQQVYVQGGDLVVVSSVSPGAELLADGNIHVYGTLRGRALAGVNGNHRARIFCHKLDAELVSIAGQYKIFEDMSLHQDGGPWQLYLDDSQMVITSL